MKFRLELPINKPRIEVWKFFTDLDNAKRWQPSLINIETIQGQLGQPGAEVKWTYLENEREFSIIEKVLRCEEPSHYESSFENEYASNTVHNEFIEQNENETLWVAETQYQFKTLLMNILGPVLKKNYVARSRTEMERLKEAVETG
jgi:uncharacterized protein YndB with AHSA1/START domain